jgi:hypothetical protein
LNRHVGKVDVLFFKQSNALSRGQRKHRVDQLLVVVVVRD